MSEHQEDVVVEEQATVTEQPIAEESLIEKHTHKQQESILETIGSTLWLWVKELNNTIWWSDKKKPAPQDASHQITSDLEKKETHLIKTRGIHEE